MSPRPQNPMRSPSAYGPQLLLTPLLFLGLLPLGVEGCKIQETGFSGNAADPGTPIAPATAAPIASDGSAPPIAVPPAPTGMVPPAPADGGAAADTRAPGSSTPPKPTPTPTPADPKPMPPATLPSDAGTPAVAVDATPSPPDTTTDGGMMPPSAPKPDVCAPPAGTMLSAQVLSRVRGADDFTFDNQGDLLLFQNRDVLRLDSNTRSSILVRNVIGLGSGTLLALPDGDLLIAETSHDHILRVDAAGKRPETTTMSLRSPLRIVPALTAGSVYVTSQTDVITLLNTATGQMKTVDQLDYRPAGIAIDPANKKLYVGATSRSVVYVYNIGPAGELSGRTVAVNQISQPTALLVDECGGLYIGGTDGGNLRRLAPDGALSVIARFEGPDITTLAFGSGKHGWSDHSLFALDTWVGTLYEVQLRK